MPTDVWLQKTYVWSSTPVSDNVIADYTANYGHPSHPGYSGITHHVQSADGTYPNATVGDSTYAP